MIHLVHETGMNDMPIRMIAMDMDGTMLNCWGKMTQRTLDALRAAQNRGVHVVVDSGRYAENAYMEVQKYGMALPVIGTNGTKIIDENGQLIYLRPYEDDVAQSVKQLLDDMECRYFMYGDRFLLTSDPEMRHHSEIGYGDKIEERFDFSYIHGKDQMTDLRGQKILKFYLCDNGKLPEAKNELMKMPGIDLTSSAENNLEIDPKGINKATGLEQYARMFGIGMEDVMAFGDHYNDLPMLLAVGWGCAMANGDADVIRQTRFTAPSNDLDGIAQMVEKYVLGE